MHHNTTQKRYKIFSCSKQRLSAGDRHSDATEWTPTKSSTTSPDVAHRRFFRSNVWHRLRHLPPRIIFSLVITWPPLKQIECTTMPQTNTQISFTSLMSLHHTYYKIMGNFFHIFNSQRKREKKWLFGRITLSRMALETIFSCLTRLVCTFLHSTMIVFTLFH